MCITLSLVKNVQNLFHNQACVRRRRCGMQVEEESPKQYADIARAPDKEMRPERPVPLGVAARARGRRSSACAYTRRCDPGAGHSAALERVLAHLRGRIPGKTSGPLLLPAARRLRRCPA